MARRVIYVDQNAPAGGDGWPTAPFETINDALGIAAARDIIQIAGGVYPEVLNITIPNLTLLGFGNNATLIAPGAPTVITVDAPDVQLVNFGINDVASSTGITFTGSARESRCRNLVLRNLQGNAYVVSGVGITFDQCKAESNNVGFFIGNSEAILRNCAAYGHNSHGFQTGGGVLRTILDTCSSQQNANGIRDAGTGTRLIDFLVYGNTTSNVVEAGTDLQVLNTVRTDGSGLLHVAHQPVIRDASVDDAQRFSAGDIGVIRGEADLDPALRRNVEELLKR